MTAASNSEARKRQQAREIPHPPATATNEGAVGAEVVGRLTEAERVQIGSAGDHHPEVCDCSSYVVDSGYAPENCCDGLLDTFAAVESILREHAERAWDEGATSVWEPLAYHAYTLGFYLDDNPYRQESTHD